VTISSPSAEVTGKGEICAGICQLAADAFGASAAVTADLVWREPTVSTHPVIRSAAAAPDIAVRFMVPLCSKLDHTIMRMGGIGCKPDPQDEQEQVCGGAA
jgi:hypothetical protein